MNFILAILLFALALMIPQERDVSHARVGGVIPDSPAATAIVQRDDGTELEERGLKEGDIIFEVDGRDVQSVGELGYHIRLNLGNTVDMRIRRTGAAGVGGVASEEFLTARVHARWSADAHTFKTTTADDSAISATDEPPIDIQIAPADGFDEAGVLVIGDGTANEERFEYCARSARFLRLTERGVDGTAPANHPGGSTVTQSVSQGPTGIQIGPAYSAHHSPDGR